MAWQHRPAGRPADDYPGSVIGSADEVIRRSAFDWLTDQRAEHGEALSRSVLESFQLNGQRIPLMGPLWNLEAGRVRAPDLDLDCRERAVLGRIRQQNPNFALRAPGN